MGGNIPSRARAINIKDSVRARLKEIDDSVGQRLKQALSFYRDFKAIACIAVRDKSMVTSSLNNLLNNYREQNVCLLIKTFSALFAASATDDKCS